MNKEILATINQRERQLLVHACLYYHYDTNIVSDFDYDRWGLQLVSLSRNYPEEFKASCEYEIFKDYVKDNCRSGFKLPYQRPDIINKALYLLRLNNLKKR